MAIDLVDAIFHGISLLMNGTILFTVGKIYGDQNRRIITLEERRKEDRKEVMADVNGIGKKLSYHLENHPPARRASTHEPAEANGHDD